MEMIKLIQSPLRLVLLGVSLFCAISSLVTILLVIRYRKLKVFKFSSPTFLGLTLIGCCVMYRYFTFPRTLVETPPKTISNL